MALLLQPLVLVFLGGGAGATLRYVIISLARQQGIGMPWPTLAINVAGSFSLGVLAVLCRDRPGWLLLLGTGVCGGFTTFSTFSLETVVLIEEKRWLAVSGYVLGSVAGAIAGAVVGLRIAR